MLQELDREHSGMSRIKAIGQSYIWWSDMDQDIEAMSKTCVAFQLVKSTPAAAPLHSWV